MQGHVLSKDFVLGYSVTPGHSSQAPVRSASRARGYYAASISVGLGSKERPKNGVFARKIGARAKIRKRGSGKGRKNPGVCLQAFPSFPSPST